MTTDTFNSGSGNWTVPAGVTSVQIELWGGGGGGGEGDGGGSGVGGSGGGAGAYCKKNALSVTPGDIIAYVVGAGGAGNTDSGRSCADGLIGGYTTVDGGTYTASAGSGGASCGSGGGGSGGVASGGDVNTSGNVGGYYSGNNGGAGANSPNGGTGGTAGVSGTSSGGTGNSPGGGGGGGGKSYYGGNGAAGRVIFTYTASETYNETATGGAVVAGTSSNNKVSNNTVSGGAVVSGNSYFNFSNTATGGVAVGGRGSANYNIIPTANQTYSTGTITYTGGSANYTNLFDASDSTYVWLSGGVSNYFSYPLTDMPSNFGQMISATIKIRMSTLGVKSNYTPIDYVQIMKSDGTTAISSSENFVNLGVQDVIVPLASLSYKDKTSWDGALLKIKVKQNPDPSDGIGLNFFEMSVDIVYSVIEGTYSDTATGGTLGGGIVLPSLVRSNIATGGAIAGGSGIDVVNTYNEDTATGGAIAGGASTNYKINNNIATGSAVLAGTSPPSLVRSNLATGGAIINDLPGFISGIEIFNSGSGNWTVPTGVNMVQIELWGAGGGGGGGDSGGGSVGATGGGGGAYCKKNTLIVTPGDIIAYVVGVGGTPDTEGSCSIGGNGGDTTVFGGTYTAGGGTGGDSCGDPGNKAGGTASGGDTNTSGGNGAAQSGNDGTAGGDSPNGGAGGEAVTSDVTGNSGNAPGGGGGGGGKRADGGAGANGRIIFNYISSGVNVIYNPTTIGGAVVSGESVDPNYYDEIGTGGGIVAGAFGPYNIRLIYNLFGDGGILLSGLAIRDELGIGGAVLSGTLINRYYEFSTGGILAGGYAGAFYDNISSGGGLLGGQYLDGSLDSGSGGIVCDGTPSFDSIYYRSGLGGLVAGGNSVNTSIFNNNSSLGGLRISGFGLILFVSSERATGGAVVGGSAVVENNNIATGGAVVGGFALLIYSNLATGGAVVGGITTNYKVNNNTTTGGAVVGGTSSPSLKRSNLATGGTVVGGISSPSLKISNLATGGAVVGGITTNYKVNKNTATGGAVVGGITTNYKVNKNTATGGIRCGSTAVLYKVNDNIATGGLTTGKKLPIIFSSPPNPIRVNYNGVLGHQFTATRDLVVTHLGRYVGSVFNLDHTIKIWRDSDQVLIASATVTPSSFVKNGWAYESCGFITLIAGVKYRIAIDEYTGIGTDNWQDDAWLYTSINTGNINVIRACIAPTLGAFPANLEVSGRSYAWPNMLFSDGVTPFLITDNISSGGGVVGGSSSSKSINKNMATGGAVVSGEITTSLTQINVATGGAVIAGTTTIASINNNIATDGVILAGTSPPSLVINIGSTPFIDLEDNEDVLSLEDDFPILVESYDVYYGVVASGISQSSLIQNNAAAGGVVVAGSGTSLLVKSNISVGGAVVDGNSAYFQINNIGYIPFILLEDGTLLLLENEEDINLYGVIVTGYSTPSLVQSNTATGGSVVGGLSIIGYNNTATGGAVVGGSGDSNLIIDTTSTGGAVVGGLAIVSFNTTSTGGAVVGGLAIVSFNNTATGGIVIGGSGDNNLLIDNISTGGVVGGGQFKYSFIFTSDGGEVLTGGSALTNYSVIIDLDVEWQTNAIISIDKSFEWNVGESPLRWYRIQGCCKHPTSLGDGINGGQSGGCEIIGIQTDDDKCIGGLGKQQFIQTLAGRGIADICQQLIDSKINWEICSIKQWSRPVVLTEEDDPCNILQEIPHCQIPKCLTFCINSDVVTNMGITTYVIDSINSYIGQGGSFTGGEGSFSLTGASLPISSSFEFESDGGETLTGGEATVSSSFANDFLTGMGCATFIESIEAVFGGEENNPALILSTQTVKTNCGSCDSMPLVIYMFHNIVNENNLVNYLYRNGLELPNPLPMHYSSRLKSWVANYHLSGIGEDNFGNENWRFSFEWSCVNSVGGNDFNSYSWKFSMLIVRYNESGEVDFDTRVLIIYPPDSVCSGIKNLSTDFSFKFNTLTKFISNNLNVSPDLTLINDSIGLFKSPYWVKNPNLSIRLSKQNEVKTFQRQNIYSIFPNFVDQNTTR